MKHKWFTRLPLIRSNHFHYTQFSLLSSLSSSFTPSIPVTVSKHKILCTSTFFKKIHHVLLNGSSTRTFCHFDMDNADDYYNNVVYEELTVDKFKSVIKTKEDEEKVEQILSSYECLKFETGLVPSTITIENMIHLLDLSVYKRAQFFATLFYREADKFIRKSQQPKPLPERHPHLEIERDAGKQQIMGIKFDPSTGAPLYGEWLNSYFIRFRKSENIHSFESNMLAGYMYGPKLFIDCDFDVNFVEAKKITYDIYYSLKSNSLKVNPFNIILTGPFSEVYRKVLNKSLLSFDPSQGYLGPSLSEKSFIDLYPKDKIIYLSPYAFHPMKYFDHDAIYVLGGLPDTQSTIIRAGSLKKVKSLQLSSYRFPLEHYFVFKKSKKLSIRECVNILDHLKDHNDMGAALKHGVDSIRYKTEEELIEEREQRNVTKLKRSLREFRKDGLSKKTS